MARTVRNILIDVGRNIITPAIRNEYIAQGHRLTNKLIESVNPVFRKEGTEYVLDIEALDYSQALEEGVSRNRTSWKQFPFLISYFIKRGLGINDAKKAAAGTIIMWGREGMSTFDSYRFSLTGERHNAIKTAIEGSENEINAYLDRYFDDNVNEITKSERI